jgi:hypothetical protein
MMKMRIISGFLAILLIIVFNSNLYAGCEPDVIFDGEANNDNYGYAVADAGDFNGDGYDDFIVGAFNYDAAFSGEGKAYIYSGFDNYLLYTIVGEDDADHLGFNVSGAGDVNGDNYDDIMVSAPFWGPSYDANGRVYIFFGGPGRGTRDASDADVILQGTVTEARFGNSVSATGTSIIVGAFFDSSTRGKVYVFNYASIDIGGLFSDTQADAVISGDNAGDRFGFDVAGIGDIDNDGNDDIIIGAPQNDGGGTEAGRAYIFLGPVSGTLYYTNADITITGHESSTGVGTSVAGLGDIDGDLHDDVLIGASYAGAANRGAAYVFYGSSLTSGDYLSSGADMIFNGAGAAYNLGTSVARAGDFDNDGHADILLGADGYNVYTGRIYVYSGADGSQLFIGDGEETGDYFGTTVAGGDFNNDGWGDLLVGAPYNSSGGSTENGRAYLYYGAPDKLFCNLIGETAGDNYGYSVSGGGDANNDGYMDLIIGAPNYDYGRVSEGRIYVVSGETHEYMYIFSGPESDAKFGVSVSWAGDCNNDGYDDIIVGAKDYSSSQGIAYVYSGLSRSLLHTFPGEAAMDYFGSSVAGAGDVNDDSYDDVIIGAPGYDGNRGKAYVYSGLTGDLLHSFVGENIEDRMGSAVSGIGDVNSDGFDDVVVGSPNYGLNVGFVNVFSGADGSQMDAFIGEGSGDYFGCSIDNAGDIDGDGDNDVFIGARGYSGNIGKAYVYRVFDEPNVLQAYIGESPGDYFGLSVAGIGDVDDDCYDDLAVGSFGKVYVYSGQTASLIDTYALGDGPLTVAGADDINMDDGNCILIGSYTDDAGGEDAGRAFVYCLGAGEVPQCYVCGDANGDQTVNVSDAVAIINYVFVGGDPPDPIESGDCNCDDVCNVSDAVWIINYVFVGGNEPCDTNGDSVPDC